MSAADRRPLRELSPQWRIDADLCDVTDRPDHARAKRLCADELDAALAEGDAAGPEPCELCGHTDAHLDDICTHPYCHCPTLKAAVERAALPPQPEWHPIATVPQDRTYVLVWQEDVGHDVYRFGPGLISQPDDPQWTHWKPLDTPRGVALAPDIPMDDMASMLKEARRRLNAAPPSLGGADLPAFMVEFALDVVRQASGKMREVALPPAPAPMFSVEELSRLKTIDRCIRHSEQTGVKLTNTLSGRQVRFLRELVERLSGLAVAEASALARPRQVEKAEEKQ